MPTSKIKVAIARILKDEGYIRATPCSGRRPKQDLQVQLRYVGEEAAGAERLKRISKPGLRVYPRRPRSRASSAAWAWRSSRRHGAS